MNCRQYSKGINSLSIPIFLLLVVFPPNYLGSEPFNHQVILKNQGTTLLSLLTATSLKVRTLASEELATN